MGLGGMYSLGRSARGRDSNSTDPISLRAVYANTESPLFRDAGRKGKMATCPMIPAISLANQIALNIERRACLAWQGRVARSGKIASGRFDKLVRKREREEATRNVMV